MLASPTPPVHHAGVARVLLIDDDRSLLDVLALSLEDAGHQVDLASDGAAGLARLGASPPPDVVISDVNLPQVDGFTLVRRARAAGHTVPIVLLTSRDSEIDEALGLELGADDYVSKPFSVRVLLARVSALVRRARPQAEPDGSGEATTVRAGDLLIDSARLEVRWQGTAITTTLTELRLLEILARGPGVVWTRDKLLDGLRGQDTHVAPRLIDTYVRRLRKKLEALDPGFDRIETVIGAGYRWRSEP